MNETSITVQLGAVFGSAGGVPGVQPLDHRDFRADRAGWRRSARRRRRAQSRALAPRWTRAVGEASVEGADVEAELSVTSIPGVEPVLELIARETYRWPSDLDLLVHTSGSAWGDRPSLAELDLPGPDSPGRRGPGGEGARSAGAGQVGIVGHLTRTIPGPKQTPIASSIGGSRVPFTNGNPTHRLRDPG